MRHGKHTRRGPYVHRHALHCHKDPHLSRPISFYTRAFLQRPLEPQRAKLIPQVSLSCWNYFLPRLSTPFPKPNASAFSTSTPHAHHSSTDAGTRALGLRLELTVDAHGGPEPQKRASPLTSHSRRPASPTAADSTPPPREERNNVIIVKPQHRHKNLGFWGCFVKTNELKNFLIFETRQ